MRRTVLIVAMAVVGYFLLIAWQKDHGALARQQAAATATAPSTAAVEVPAAPAAVPAPAGDAPVAPATAGAGDLPVAPQKAAPEGIAAPVANGQRISVRTDVLDVQIDLTGGDLVRAALPAYTESIESTKPFVLMDQSAERTYIAQSGLIGQNGPDASADGRPRYQASAASHVLKDGENTLQVVLTLPEANGVTVRKIYEFTRGNYLVKVRYEVVNKGAAPWKANLFGQFKRDNTADPSAANQGLGMATFLGAAWWTPEEPYNKLALEDFSEEKDHVKLTTTGGWMALVQHYFVAAWVPDAKASNHYSTRRNAAGDNFLVVTGPEFSVAPGQVASVASSLYIGPKIQKSLEAISPGLELTVDYGWLWFIAQFLFWVLVSIHTYIVPNWGWSIILLTVLVKLAFFQLSATSYKSMAHLRRVTPEMQRIRETYANDRAKMSQAMMELYKKEKINPLGGCLPILVQMPVFIALYWTLMESVELRHAGWILWIKDLSVMDPWFVLPILMTLSMVAQTALNPAPTDPLQARIMKIMPWVFGIMFLWFPAGLVLYWVVNNLLSIAQQWVITRQIEKADAKRA